MRLTNISSLIIFTILVICVTNCKSKKNSIIQDPIYSERIGKFPNKTLNDSIFSKGDVIRIPEIVFVLDGNSMENYDSLKVVANFIKKHPEFTFEIESHVDSRGYAEKNIELTEKRAKNTKDYLIKEFSVNPSQLTSKGYGETQPLIPDTELSKAKSAQEKEEMHRVNRRIVLTIITVK